MITKREMESRSKRNNPGGAKARKGQSIYLWTCSSSKEFCTGKFSSKVNNFAHGSPEDAMRCIKRASRSLAEG